jgi:hypothetical protein
VRLKGRVACARRAFTSVLKTASGVLAEWRGPPGVREPEEGRADGVVRKRRVGPTFRMPPCGEAGLPASGGPDLQRALALIQAAVARAGETRGVAPLAWARGRKSGPSRFGRRPRSRARSVFRRLGPEFGGEVRGLEVEGVRAVRLGLERQLQRAVLPGRRARPPARKPWPPARIGEPRSAAGLCAAQSFMSGSLRFLGIQAKQSPHEIRAARDGFVVAVPVCRLRQGRPSFRNSAMPAGRTRRRCRHTSCRGQLVCAREQLDHRSRRSQAQQLLCIWPCGDVYVRRLKRELPVLRGEGRGRSFSSWAGGRGRGWPFRRGAAVSVAARPRLRVGLFMEAPRGTPLLASTQATKPPPERERRAAG